MDIKIVFHAVFFFKRRVSGRTKCDATPIFWSFSRFSALTYGPTKTGTTSSKLVIQYLHTSCMSSSYKIYFGLSSTPHHPHHPIFGIHINTLHFFLSCYTSQVLGSCQKPRFRFAVTTLLFFVFPAMAAGYIAPYYPSTTEEEVAGRWTPIFGEEAYVDPWPLTLQKDGFWLNSIKEGITCLKSWSICNA